MTTSPPPILDCPVLNSSRERIQRLRVTQIRNSTRSADFQIVFISFSQRCLSEFSGFWCSLQDHKAQCDRRATENVRTGKTKQQPAGSHLQKLTTLWAGAVSTCAVRGASKLVHRRGLARVILKYYAAALVVLRRGTDKRVVVDC